jgi:FAD/FMN-containing dehydrogenase
MMKRRTFVRTGLASIAGLALSRAPLPDHYLTGPRSWRDLVAVTGDGREVTLTRADLEEFASALDGRLLLADHDHYEEARQILNPSFDRYPALIAQVAGEDDVRVAVDFARDHGGLLLAVKCGGHSFAGHSTCDRGMMIDLSAFRHVEVDPLARRAWVSGGSLLGSVDQATMAHGLVTPLGTVSHTGVGGLVTGGGFGRLSRRLGLSIDNLESVEVVSADGVLRRATATENPDLFWGVRGGGGNFGIVTTFEFGLHAMQEEVVAGRILYPASRAREVLEIFAEYGAVAPRELQIDQAVVYPPEGVDGLAGFAVCFSGDLAEADRALAPLRALGEPMMDTVARTPYVEAQRSGDSDDPRARATYLYGGFVPAVPPDLIGAIVDGLSPDPGRGTQVVLLQTGGAIADVAPGATAFSQRDAAANMLCSVGWRHGDEPNAHIEYVRGFWQDLSRFTHGFYVNDMSPDATVTAIRDNFERNHSRLVAVKDRYDPNNLFRLNANIPPSVDRLG